MGIGSRTFSDSSGDYIDFAIGGSGETVGASTWAACIHVATSTYEPGVVGILSSGNAQQMFLTLREGDRRLSLQDGGVNAGYSSAAFAEDVWVIVVGRHPATFGTARFSVCVHNGSSWGSWTHTDLGSIGGPGSVASTSKYRVGGHDWSSLNGHIAAAARWGSQLSDGDVETLSGSLQAWLDLSPVHAWRFDQASVGTAVTDLVGSVDQSAISGTSVGPTSPLDEGGTPTAPGQVTGLTVSPGHDGELDLAWTAPATGGSAITDYLIERAPDSGGSPGSWSTVTDGTSTATSYTDTGLTNGSTYWYRVSAINAIGTGTASTATSGTPTDLPTVIGAAKAATIATSRSPSLTFDHPPRENDIVIMWPSSTGTGITLTIPSGWENPLGGTTDVESDAHQISCVAHRVTSGEAAANTVTFTATNLFGANTSGNVVGAVVANVDPTTMFAGANSAFSSTNTVTPHVLASVVPTVDDGLVLSAVAKDATGAYSSQPTGWTFLVTFNTNQGKALLRANSLTTDGVTVGPTNITPSAGDEYASITVVLAPIAVSAVEVNPVGAAVTAVAGTANITGQADVTPDGAVTVAVAGVASIAGTAQIAPTGAVCVAVAGTANVTASATVTPTGASVTAVAGTAQITSQADVAPVGGVVQAVAGVAALTATADVTPQGAAVVAVAGVADIGSAVEITPTGAFVAAVAGTANVTGHASVTPVGAVCTPVAGIAQVTGQADVTPVGSVVEAVAGTANIGAAGSVEPVGGVVTAVAGVAEITATADISPTGAVTTAAAGVAAISATANITPTGAAITAVAGVADVTGTVVVNPVGGVVVAVSTVVAVTAQADIAPVGAVVVVVSGTADVTSLVDDPYPVTWTIRDRGHTATVQDVRHTATVRDRGHTVTVDDDSHTATIRDRSHATTARENR